MNNTGFKTGDIVRLKTGGPRMTVGGCSKLLPLMSLKPDHVPCCWFVGMELFAYWFHKDAIEISDTTGDATNK